MSRAVVTHFDGDPFTLYAWLVLYEKYWRGECDKVYMTVYYNPKTVPQEVVDFNKRLIADFPEIVADIVGESKPPEIGNQRTLAKVTEDYVGLIESDGYIYGKGVVDQCFRLMENEGQDIVAPPWELITEPYFNGDLQSKGFMRCFTFVRKSILDKTDCDFMPKTIPANTKIVDDHYTERVIELDCFGWLSWQLLLLTRKITTTPGNVLGPDNIMAPYSNFKWVHVRQMSSSAIGMGGGDFEKWNEDAAGAVVDQIIKLYGGEFPEGPAEYIYIKAVAFKLLFWDILINKHTIKSFANDYRQILESVIDCYNLPREKIYEIKGFYKGLFNL